LCEVRANPSPDDLSECFGHFDKQKLADIALPESELRLWPIREQDRESSTFSGPGPGLGHATRVPPILGELRFHLAMSTET
jgi:hypothetical protein